YGRTQVNPLIARSYQFLVAWRSVIMIAPWTAALLGSELRPRIGFQESAHRTPERAHRDALFRRDLGALPEGLLRRPLDPGADHALGALGFEDEPLHHRAVALGTPSRFRAHTPTSEREGE